METGVESGGNKNRGGVRRAGGGGVGEPGHRLTLAHIKAYLEGFQAVEQVFDARFTAASNEEASAEVTSKKEDLNSYIKALEHLASKNANVPLTESNFQKIKTALDDLSGFVQQGATGDHAIVIAVMLEKTDVIGTLPEPVKITVQSQLPRKKSPAFPKKTTNKLTSNALDTIEEEPDLLGEEKEKEGESEAQEGEEEEAFVPPRLPIEPNLVTKGTIVPPRLPSKLKKPSVLVTKGTISYEQHLARSASSGDLSEEPTLPPQETPQKQPPPPSRFKKNPPIILLLVLATTLGIALPFLGVPALLTLIPAVAAVGLALPVLAVLNGVMLGLAAVAVFKLAEACLGWKSQSGGERDFSEGQGLGNDMGGFGGSNNPVGSEMMKTQTSSVTSANAAGKGQQDALEANNPEAKAGTPSDTNTPQ